MKRRWIFWALATFWLLSVTSQGQAQFPIQGRPGMGGGFGGGLGGFGQSTPTVSPYINLLRGGNSTLVNYYGLVRPEQQFQQALQQVGQQANMNSQAINGMEGAPVTGSSIRFMNTNPYFLSMNRAGGMGGGGMGAGFLAGGMGGANQGIINSNFGMGRTGLNQASPFGQSGLMGPVPQRFQTPQGPVPRN